MADRRKKGSRPASLSAPRNPVVKMWLMDTGCGHDLITRADVLKMKEFAGKVSTSVKFNTANGLAKGVEVVDLFVEELS
eukprot:11169048-Lingulodinium_polyedra.AAC.1